MIHNWSQRLRVGWFSRNKIKRLVLSHRCVEGFAVQMWPAVITPYSPPPSSVLFRVNWMLSWLCFAAGMTRSLLWDPSPGIMWVPQQCTLEIILFIKCLHTHTHSHPFPHSPPAFPPSCCVLYLWWPWAISSSSSFLSVSSCLQSSLGNLQQYTCTLELLGCVKRVTIQPGKDKLISDVSAAWECFSRQ